MKTKNSTNRKKPKKTGGVPQKRPEKTRNNKTNPKTTRNKKHSRQKRHPFYTKTPPILYKKQASLNTSPRQTPDTNQKPHT